MTEFKKVLVLYVGGTIGMQKNDKGVYIPTPNALLEKVKTNPEMHDALLAKKYFRKLKSNELMLPCNIVYEIIEYNPLVDSSNMNLLHWKRIAEDIKHYYNHFNGFVVLHGTDTLAYTSSALSFMLDGLQKPVILSGSQIPIFETRSDAKSNFLSSLLIAGLYDVPEVCIFFANKLLRGNRTTKISSNLLNAFDSPNYHTLADVGIDINVHNHYIRLKEKSELKINTNFNPNIGVFTMYPTITGPMLRSFIFPLEGVVLQSYGVGNIPTEKSELLEVINEAVKRKILILNITQCAQGAVSPDYETGQALDEVGVVSGNDMTVEAALTKLSFVLGLNIDYREKVELLRNNLKGELTDNNNS